MKPLLSLVDASAAGEGNLEILVQVGDQSLPTDVQPLGNAIFGVSFEVLNESPPGGTEPSQQSELSSIELSKRENYHQLQQQQQPHIIYITFNDDNVPGNHNKNNNIITLLTAPNIILK